MGCILEYRPTTLVACGAGSLFQVPALVQKLRLPWLIVNKPGYRSYTAAYRTCGQWAADSNGQVRLLFVDDQVYTGQTVAYVREALAADLALATPWTLHVATPYSYLYEAGCHEAGCHKFKSSHFHHTVKEISPCRDSSDGPNPADSSR